MGVNLQIFWQRTWGITPEVAERGEVFVEAAVAIERPEVDLIRVKVLSRKREAAQSSGNSGSRFKRRNTHAS